MTNEEMKTDEKKITSSQKQNPHKFSLVGVCIEEVSRIG
jgi:hypothetical protein